MLMKGTHPDGSAKDHLHGVKDKHKAPDVMSDLIYNTKYDMASAMLFYIDATSYGVHDGLHYVDAGIDVELYRKTFRMVFEYMH